MFILFTLVVFFLKKSVKINVNMSKYVGLDELILYILLQEFIRFSDGCMEDYIQGRSLCEYIIQLKIDVLFFRL